MTRRQIPPPSGGVSGDSHPPNSASTPPPELDVGLLPAVPGEWRFIMLDAEVDRGGALARELAAQGFVVAAANAAADALGARTVLLASAATLDSGARPAPERGAETSWLVAFAAPGDLAAGLAARRAGACRVLATPPAAARLVTELAGLAWWPRVPWRVLLVEAESRMRDELARRLRDAGCEVLAHGDAGAAVAQAGAFDAEVLVLGAGGAASSSDLLAILRGASGLAGLPAVAVASASPADDAEWIAPTAAQASLAPRVIALARAWRLRQSASRQRRLLLSQLGELQGAVDAHAMVTVVATDGTIIDANPRFCEVSGYAREELIGRNHRVVKSGRHSPAFFEEMWRTISAGQAWHGEVQNRRRDGSHFWVQGTIAPVLDGEGKPLRYIWVHTEITAQKAALAERERQCRLLDAIRQSLQCFIVDRDLAASSALLLDAIQSISESDFGFIGEVVHDGDGQPFLRAHAISNLVWSPDARRMQEAIRNGGLEMRNLDSLYGAALTGGEPVIANDPASDPRHSPLPPGHPPLESFLGLPIRHGQTMVGMVGLANRVGGYDDEMVEFLAPIAAAYGAIVEAARMRALQRRVIDELRDAHEPGDSVGRTALGVLANWRGEFRNRLNAIVGNAQILTLDEGLAAASAEQAREIAHAGEMLVSEFETLIARLEPVAPTAASASTHVSANQSSGAANRILVAEDNPANQAVLRMQLEVLGHVADIAPDGAAALAKWRSGGHDLILADRNMPGMDGIDLTRAIRASERSSGSHVPIIAITAANHAGELSLCLEAGMDDALAKPIELDQLRALLDRWLPRGQTSAESTVGGTGDTGAILDAGYLERIVGHVEPGQLRELVDLFTATAHADLPECRRLLDAGDGRGLGLAMHRLKSSARMVGALRFAALAERLEAAAIDGAPEQLRAQLDALEHAVIDVETAVLRVAVAPAPTLTPRADVVPGLVQPRRVLVVDDDPVARHQLGLLLAALNVPEVVHRDGGAAALQALSGADGACDMVITDLNMPGMDGIEFLRRLVDIDYRGHVILCSGVKDRLLHTAADLTRTKGLRLLGTLKKPARREALLELLVNPNVDTRGLARPVETVAVSPQDIAEGMRRDEFDIQFQPKVDARTLRFVGVEALARWTRGGRGVAPDTFIRAAERHGMIGPLSEVLVTKALIGGARMADAGFPLQVAINLSASWLADVRLPEFIMATINATGFRPENLVVEVTETGVLADIPTSMDVMTRLRLKGFKLSIDDFGIGYSSMEQLQRFPFGELKLDRAFVQGADNPTTRDILASTLDMARKLKLTTVAEGVETQAELDLVRGLGCDLVQGWLVAPSMPVDELIAWARARESGRR